MLGNYVDSEILYALRTRSITKIEYPVDEQCARNLPQEARVDKGFSEIGDVSPCNGRATIAQFTAGEDSEAHQRVRKADD